MPVRPTPLLLLLLCCAAATPPTPPSREHIDAANRLVAQLRNQATPFEQKSKFAEELLALDVEGPKRLAPLARSEFLNRRTAYASRFEKVAADFARARLTPDVLREVERHRQEIQSVLKAPGLSKELIVSRADPALKRLDELLGLSPGQVAEAAPDLQKQRTELLAWLDWSVAAVEKLPEADRKNLPAPAELKALRPELEEVESLMALLALPTTSADDRRVLVANVPLARQLDPEEAAGALYLNQIRLRVGLSALAIDLKLCNASRDHSKDMVANKFFDHTSPTPGRETPFHRANLAGTRASAENIAMGVADGKAALRIWWHSPGHLRNMMANHKRQGLGRADKTWTQMFG